MNLYRLQPPIGNPKVVDTIPVLPDSDIDRIAPTRRPSGLGVMRQVWEHLLFLHWRVPADALRPHVPPELEIDTYRGEAFLGLVPFTMCGIRLPGLPAFWGLSTFPEVNVRTYVHCGGRHPGVWFFSLDAANSLAVRFARGFWHLPYHRARMRVTVEGDPSAPSIDYRSERLWPGPLPAACRLRYRAAGSPGPASPGTLEHFLVERYLLYAKRGQRLFRGQVHHEPYPLQPAEVVELDESLIAAAGLERPVALPLTHFAAGVRVRVYPLQAVHEATADRYELATSSTGRAS